MNEQTDSHNGWQGIDGSVGGEAPRPGRRRARGPGRQVPPRGRLSPLAWWWVCLLALLPLAACDDMAARQLVPGQHTEADVRRWMGQPEMIWEDEDGTRVLEYPRGKAGKQTHFVTIAPDGRYRGMEPVLTEENFARLLPGMDRDRVRQILGKPAEIDRFALSQEEVWGWRYQGADMRIMYFNAHFDQQSDRLKGVSRTEDWKAWGQRR